MKKAFQFSLILLFVFTACQKNTSKNLSTQKVSKTNANYLSYGDNVSLENVSSTKEMEITFNSLKIGDTVPIKFASKINDVCSKKGCWMKLPIGEQEAMVRFKNYGFFIPKDSKNKDVIVKGRAFLKTISVKELQHYALDAGKSKAEIATITKPKNSFAFVASGVLIKNE